MSIEELPEVEIDKGYEWKPNSKPQETFLSLPDTIRECLYGGAVGGGKSEVLLHLPLVRGFIKHPKFQAIYFRESFPELEKSLISRAQIIYPKFGGKYNGQDHVFRFESGAKIWFDYMEKDSDAHKHDSDEYNLICWEELTAFTEYQYLYMFTRCRSGSKDLPRLIRAASNPLGKGHTWVRSRFIDPARMGMRVIEDKGTKRIFIPAKASDNPDLLRNNPDYFNDLRHLPETLRKAKIEGDWYVVAGQVFTEWRERNFEGEPSNAVHVVQPFEIPQWWPKVIGLDWGMDHNTSAHWNAISPDGRSIVYREMVVRKTPISVWAADLQRFSQYDGNIVGIELDPSAWANRGMEKTIADIVISNVGMIPVNQAMNDRIGGRMNFHEFLRWKEKPARYRPAEGYREDVFLRIWRMYGEDDAKKYRRMFEPEEPEKNLPRLQIFSTCPELIRTIPTIAHDENRPEDTKKFDGDDAYDSERYALKAVDRHITECKMEFERQQELAKIISMKDSDPTSFYIRMREHENSGTPKSLRQFHKKFH